MQGQPPGAGPEVLPTDIDSTQLNQSLPVYDLMSLPVNLRVRQRWMGNWLHQLVSTSKVNCREIQLTRTSLKMPTIGRLSEGSDPSWAGIRPLTTTVHLPPGMIIHLPVPKPSQPVKCLVKLPVDEWLCRKFEKLNATVAEGYPSRNTETGGLLRDQFVKTPRSSKWYAMHTDKKDSVSTTVCDWSLEGPS